jgi:LacI family transcriptional regulator
MVEETAIDRTARMTIRDIAELAGVSTATVSRTMNGKDGVGQATRSRIEQIMTEHKFTADSSAQQLSTGRSRAIAVVFPLHVSAVVMHPVYPALLGALCDAAEGSGYDVMLLTVSSPDRVGHLIDAVLRRRVDGVVLPAAGPRDRLIHELRAVGAPTVVIGHRTTVDGVGWVDCTHDKATAELTRMMIDGGRRNLTLLNGPKSVSACRLRSAGFWAAVKETKGRVVAAEVETEWEAEPALMRARELFATRPRPTAVLCGSDTIASSCLEAAREAGLSVPDDVAVTGFDDRSLGLHTTPTLTSVQMPLRETGEAAAQLLIAMIEGDPPKRRHVVLPTHVVVRESAAFPVMVPQR